MAVERSGVTLQIVDATQTSASEVSVLADSSENPDALFIGGAFIAKNGKKIVYQDTSASSSLRSLYIAAGAAYSESTNRYSLNGITDITESEMRNIYLRCAGRIGSDAKCAFCNLKVRTNLPINGDDVYNGGFDARGMFAETSVSDQQTIKTITLALTNGNSFLVYNAANMFWNAGKLENIIGILYMWNCSNVFRMFAGCTALKTVHLWALHQDISFENSPYISAESLNHAISHANGTNFTITVHANTYAKLTSTSSTYADYHSVYTTALSKNIAFASA